MTSRPPRWCPLNNRILITIYCLVHQHGRPVLCLLSLLGINENAQIGSKSHISIYLYLAEKFRPWGVDTFSVYFLTEFLKLIKTDRMQIYRSITAQFVRLYNHFILLLGNHVFRNCQYSRDLINKSKRVLSNKKQSERGKYD